MLAAVVRAASNLKGALPCRILKGHHQTHAKVIARLLADGVPMTVVSEFVQAKAYIVWLWLIVISV